MKKLLFIGLFLFYANELIYAETTISEYWFDEDYDSKKTYTLPSPNKIISMGALSPELKNGMHRITYRVVLSKGVLSGPMSDWFEKGNPYLPVEDEQYITEYKYWADDAAQTEKRVKTRHAKSLNLDRNLFLLEEIPSDKHFFKKVLF